MGPSAPPALVSRAPTCGPSAIPPVARLTSNDPGFAGRAAASHPSAVARAASSCPEPAAPVATGPTARCGRLAARADRRLTRWAGNRSDSCAEFAGGNGDAQRRMRSSALRPGSFDHSSRSSSRSHGGATSGSSRQTGTGCRAGGLDRLSSLELDDGDGSNRGLGQTQRQRGAGGGGGGGSGLSGNRFNGVFLLLLLNFLAYLADHLLRLPVWSWLYLHHSAPRWYQFVTATFCHANWSHLSSNLFFLYIFGRLVEEQEGSVGVWVTYLVTGAGSNLVSWLLLPASTVSVGASGAVFGLFVVSVLTRLQWDWRRILEVVILGQFVVEKVMSEARNSAIFVSGGTVAAASGVNHIAHLAGALLGVLLIWMISRLPEGSGNQEDGSRNNKGKSGSATGSIG
eukprot:TRINITY_DN24153_c0_g1_i2.p1 TRINITY_DN24153_c0_g1~~TRINITY_DN24153_c0_g1_i2.p1  ORF type:complete len:399 (+),score=-16.88 TRINITY_DN24153_c0_g1_i2:201-1397(+)